MYINEIYIRDHRDLRTVYTHLQYTCNLPLQNPEGTSLYYISEDGIEHMRIQFLGMELWLVPNIGSFLIPTYGAYQYYLFLRWNPVDREPAQEAYSPLFRVLANLLYRSGYEIEVDHVLSKQQRERIKQQDPIAALEEEIESNNPLGL